jgi:hypothetical protein
MTDAPVNAAATTNSTARARRRPGGRLSTRAVIGITLVAVWAAATLTGVLLYVAPDGRRSGSAELLFGLTKSSWGDVHWWVSLAAVAVTVVHLVVDWKTFRSCVRHLVHTH